MSVFLHEEKNLGVFSEMQSFKGIIVRVEIFRVLSLQVPTRCRIKHDLHWRMGRTLMTALFLFIVSQQAIAATNNRSIQGNFISPVDEIRTCICNPGGLFGTQNYSSGTEGFTDCSCSSYCPLCPIGQVLDPVVGNHYGCSCVSPLSVVIKLVDMHLSTFTQKMEQDFIMNIASFLQVSPAQVIPVGRRSGSVILDIYIVPAHGTNRVRQELNSIAAFLVQTNSSHHGFLVDTELGPFTFLSIENLTPGAVNMDSIGDSNKVLGGKLLLPALILLVTFGILVLMTSLVCLLYRKRKLLKQSLIFWFGKDMSSHSFTTMTSQRSSLSEEFQVYDNTCFSGSTGCIGRGSLKVNSRMVPLLGTVIRQFSFSDLYAATHGFSKQNLTGLGGSSCVYRGHLKDGREVAVKRLATRHGPDMDREFLLEVDLLSRLHHFHLVPLIGYCIESHGRDVERLLVYDYMPNGNLREHLNKALGKESINWIARVRIALGAARGLEYLHESADPKVLHRDFKSSNILLDGKWRAKVADFGMATTIINVECNTCPSSPAEMLGTFGYFAPEYAMMGRASTKSDVFSFGVVLLELISGRQPLDKTLPSGQESLVVWALPLLRDEKTMVSEVVDPTLKKKFPSDDIKRMAQLAWACLQSDPDLRPTMTSVVHVLATMAPENARRSSICGPLLAGVEEEFHYLPWAEDYSFSRDDIFQNHTPLADLWNINSASILDNNCKNAGQRSHDRRTLLAEIEEEMANEKRDLIVAPDALVRSTSLTAAEYLQRLTVMTANNPVRRSPEEEALDLMKPRLESFWQNNALLVQVSSPSR